MQYIIDANNLAGKLGILKEENFDQKLINIIRKWVNEKNKQVMLVFDSVDPMGDKYREGTLTVIYAPRDNYYKSADDKIIELVKKYISEEVAVVTDDREIREKVENISNEVGNRANLIKATDFSDKLTKFLEKQKSNHEVDNKRELNEDDIEEINRELMEIWK